MTRFLHGMIRAIAEAFPFRGPVHEIGSYQVSKSIKRYCKSTPKSDWHWAVESPIRSGESSAAVAHSPPTSTAIAGKPNGSAPPHESACLRGAAKRIHSVSSCCCGWRVIKISCRK